MKPSQWEGYNKPSQKAILENEELKRLAWNQKKTYSNNGEKRENLVHGYKER